MGKSSIRQSIAELIEPLVRDQSLELVDIEYKKEGKNWYLRVYLDKEQGITVRDCQKLSHQIEDLIEVEAIVSNPFILEVSSPGLNRPLKTERDFLRNKNRRIIVTTFSPVNNKKNFHGTIKDFKNQILYLDEDGNPLEIPLGEIANAKLEISFL